MVYEAAGEMPASGPGIVHPALLHCDSHPDISESIL